MITIMTGDLVSSMNRLCFLSHSRISVLLFHICGWPRPTFLYDQARETRQKHIKRGKESFTHAACRRHWRRKSWVFAIPLLCACVWIPPLFLPSSRRFALFFPSCNITTVYGLGFSARDHLHDLPSSCCHFSLDMVVMMRVVHGEAISPISPKDC